MSSVARRFVEGPLTDAALAAGPALLRALGATWRVRHVGTERVDRFGRGPVLYAFSHGVLLPLAYTHRRRDIQVLISESRDGEIIARVTERLGFGTVRGSSTRGGERAILRLAALAKRGYDVAVTPDGPRGPRGSVAPGVVRVARRAELPIVPAGVAADRAWNARSWDRFLVPMPFAGVWIVYGEGIRATSAPPEEVEEKLRTAMSALEEEASSYAQGLARPSHAVRIPA